MPTYDYRCDACHATYDVFHKVREVVEDVICPRCGSTAHTRLISAPVVSMGKSSASSFDAGGAPSCSDGSCCGGSCGLN
ncbi:MAG: zinc ribbon domain-containing protein [Bacteroidota bacterium]